MPRGRVDEAGVGWGMQSSRREKKVKWCRRSPSPGKPTLFQSKRTNGEHQQLCSDKSHMTAQTLLPMLGVRREGRQQKKTYSVGRATKNTVKFTVRKRKTEVKSTLAAYLICFLKVKIDFLKSNPCKKVKYIHNWRSYHSYS